jgi:leader peptidase (prepilin peptidase)/N-methyltransferase
MMTICSVLGMLGICSIEDIRKKEIQSIRVLCFGIGGILLHLWQRNQSLYSMLGGIAVGAVVIILSLVSGGIIGIGDGLVLCVAGIYIGGINTMRLLLTTFPVLSVCTGIAVHAQKKTKRHHSFYSVSAGSISHSVDFIRQWKKKCYLPASYTIEAAVIVPMILAIFCTLIVVSYELHDRVKLAAEESSKNKIECMEEIYIGDML